MQVICFKLNRTGSSAAREKAPSVFYLQLRLATGFRLEEMTQSCGRIIRLATIAESLGATT